MASNAPDFPFHPSAGFGIGTPKTARTLAAAFDKVMNRIWRKSGSQDPASDALEQALRARGKSQGVTHHSDRGVVSISPSVIQSDWQRQAFRHPLGQQETPTTTLRGETINGLYKAEIIYKDGSWHEMDDVERAALSWTDWFNNRRLIKPLGDIPSRDV